MAVLDQRADVLLWLQGFKSDIVEAMGELMTEAGMKVVLPLPKARVPVVKFVVPETGTKVPWPPPTMTAMLISSGSR